VKGGTTAMLTYVISNDGQPLMPTERCGKVRRLLREKKAKVISRCPFTIQLLYSTGNHVQPVTLGTDAGSKTIGISATTKDKELYASEVELRNDIVKNLSARREMRRARRNRKTRYRAPRFDNRIHAKNKGWLAPSVEQKVQTHLTVTAKVCKLLPVSKIVIETASFDIQKIKNPEIAGIEYQQGEQLGFWNVREYVLWRDNHTCQCCKGKSGDKILNVHHKESRKIGGNTPDNLVTLCETCHTGYHQGKVKLPDKLLKRGESFRDASFMGIMRWAFYNRAKELYEAQDIEVAMTYGYITKHTRIRHGLEKTHAVDARCITGNPQAKPLDYFYYQKKVRCHNRQLHKMTISKGGYRRANQAPKYVKGYQLFDKVQMPTGETGFIFGRRSSGYFDVRKLDSTKLSASISYKKLKLLEKRKSYLTERRMRCSSPCLKAGVSAT